MRKWQKNQLRIQSKLSHSTLTTKEKYTLFYTMRELTEVNLSKQMKRLKSAKNRRSTRGDAQSSKMFKIEGPKRTKCLATSGLNSSSCIRQWRLTVQNTRRAHWLSQVGSVLGKSALSEEMRREGGGFVISPVLFLSYSLSFRCHCTIDPVKVLSMEDFPASFSLKHKDSRFFYL